jgi:hypothetical protein
VNFVKSKWQNEKLTIFGQEKCTFSADYLVVSRKSSTFACFFAARGYACVYMGREIVMKKSKTKRLN